MDQPIAIIDLNALRHNFLEIKKRAPHSRILAMIKSDGYGHRAVEMALTLTDADMFGVARLGEALALRNADIKQPILLMPGFLTEDELALIVEYNIDIVVHHQHQIDALKNTHITHPFNVWLKFNTGMNRLGFDPDEATTVYTALRALKNVGTIRFMTHFACTDKKEHPMNKIQFDRLNKLRKQLPALEWSAAKSSSIFNFPETNFDWVRPGIALYGISPFADQTGESLGLQPVMTLKAPVISVHTLKKGEVVSYSGIWTAPEDMKLAVIGIGYADGYPRHMAQGAPILINGKKAFLIGRICMDMLMVDLRENQTVQVGDIATLWGDGLPIEPVAQLAGTTAYELVCNVDKRVKYIFKHRIIIKVNLVEQTVCVIEQNKLLHTFSVSTAKNGAGELKNTDTTPRGLHEVVEKIGEDQPEDAVFVSRKPTGEIYSAALAKEFSERDWILTRIIWLGGKEPGKNKCGNVDTKNRYIYFHGTPSTNPMGVPESHGCIRMRNKDLLTVFSLVEVGTLVEIK